VNHPLARALRGAGVNTVDVAARLGVDPKTVERWIVGRLPYPRHRNALVQLTGWSPHDLWPNLPRRVEPEAAADEVRVAYPHRTAVPFDAWARLFGRAEHEIGILAYSALFLAEDVAVSSVLCEKAKAGVPVRIALGDPNGMHVASRGEEERIGDGMAARIRTALVGFQSIIEAGAHLRVHDTVLYNSIYRADDELLVNTHVYGRPGAHAPTFHLKGIRPEGMAATYLASFDRVWSGAEPPSAPIG
jgi:hypothetical protein